MTVARKGKTQRARGKNAEAAGPTAAGAVEAPERWVSFVVEACIELYSSPKPLEVLNNVLSVAQKFITADAYGVWRWQDANTWACIAAQGLSDSYPKVVHGLPDEELPTETTMIEDTRQNEMLSSRHSSHEREGIRSLLMVPLRISDQPRAILNFYFRRKHAFDERERQIAVSIGSLATAALLNAESIERQQELRDAAERAEQRAKLLAEAGMILSSSLEYETTLANIAELAVPRFADSCIVDLLVAPDRMQRVALQYSNPDKLRVMQELGSKYPPRPGDVRFLTIETREPIMVSQMSEQNLLNQARNDDHLRLLRKLEIKSVIVSPLVFGSEALGVLTLAYADSGRCYDEADLQFANELSRRAAVAISHARFYRDAKQSEERLALAASIAKVGIWELDFLNQTLVASPQCSVNTGLAADRMLTYSDLITRIHEDDRARWLQAFTGAIAEKSVFECEHRLWWPDGSVHWLLTYGRCLCNPNGSAQRMVGAVIDVTERRRGEEERQELLVREQGARGTAELLNRLGPVLASQLQLEPLMQSVTDIATRLTGAQFGGCFHVRAGEDGETLTSYTLSGASREEFEKLGSIRETPFLALTFRDRQVVRVNDVREHPLFGKKEPHFGLPEGHLPIRSYLGAPIVSRSGEVLGALLFAHESPGMFTEQHEQIVIGICAQTAIAMDNAKLFDEVRSESEKVREGNRALMRTNESLRQFAYAAAHDLKEPLRMVSLYAQMLGRIQKEHPDAKAAEFLQYVRDGADRMQTLVDDLLAFTQAGDLEGEAPVAVNLNRVMDRVASILKAAINESGATIEWQELPVIPANEGAAVQLFQNLIANAIKYRRKGLAPEVRISVESRPKEWLFRVADNGIGIDPAYHRQVFGIFKRLHQTEYPGTGIGLAICQRVVERYGGTIWIESEEGSGATFLFTWPKHPKHLNGTKQ